MKDDLPYFSHDNDARNHPKMKALRARYGWTGYGQFWALNEMIAGSSGARLDLTRPVVFAAAACELGMTPDALRDFVAFLADPDACGLVDYEGGVLTTDRTQEDYSKVDERRTAYRERKAAYRQKRDNPIVSRDNPNVSRDNGDCLTGQDHKGEEKRGEEKRGEEKRGEESQEARAEKVEEPRGPTLEEVAAYCRERRNGIDAQHFVDYHAARGWMLGGSLVVDWRAVVRTWETRERPEGALALRSDAWTPEMQEAHQREIEERARSPDEAPDLVAMAGDTPLGRAIRAREEATEW